MSKSAKELLAALGDLRRSITVEAAKRIERWQPDIEQPSFTASASNLAHYLAFRHHDLRPLQLELMRHGLSSLGRLESRVMVTLTSVESALEACCRRAHHFRLAALQRRILQWRTTTTGKRTCPAGWRGGSRRGPDPGDAADRGGARPGLHAGDRAARRGCGPHKLRT